MKEIIIVIISVIGILFLNRLIFKPCRDFENKRCLQNGISMYEYQKYECEKNNGIFFSGGLLGSNSCTIIK
jgi:hypothetical protein